MKVEVAIGMVTFNQAEFISQAIESVLSQKTNFTFMLVIADDCSTDTTKEICEQYVLEFPDKVSYFRNEKNLGFSVNGQINYERCFNISTKYIALLEGDDFWIDDEKLQKQYNILENPQYKDFVICSTNYLEYFNDSNEFNNRWAYFQGIYGREMPRGAIFEINDSDGWKTKTATNFFRKNALKIRKIWRYKIMVDSILVYELSKQGKKIFLNECTAAYRIQPQGNWSMKSDEEKKLMTNKIHAEIRRVNYIKEVVIKKIKKHFGFINNI
jgi:glycosyltransferase involved in cell wall biosynthesis